MNYDQGRSERQEAWAAGDYAVFGSKLVIVSELQCEAIDLRSNQRVLDVATGHGNTALAAARRGCDVIGIDFSAPLLEQARQRAAAEHMKIEFREGDMEDIPFSSGSFDVVLSTFGVMFAADQHTAAEEILRVCRNNGSIGVVNWTNTGANSVENEVISRYFPPEPDAPPNLWTTETGVWELIGHGVTGLKTESHKVLYRFPSTKAYVDSAINRFGPFIKMVESLTADERNRLENELVTELEGFNQSGDETLVLPFDYLEVRAIK